MSASCPIRLFAGGIAPLPPEGQASGIVKRAVTGRIRLGPEGLAGDRQADRRFHGGPEKALHHYPAEHYARLRAHAPDASAILAAGLLGENLSTVGWTEAEVCIGDIFAIGACRVQVSQPRKPCWKIDARTGVGGMSRFIADQGLTGWYYRVLKEGELATGDDFALIERPAPSFTLARLWAAMEAHRPDPEELYRLSAAPGLAPQLAQRLADRCDWLRKTERPC